jgi:hypothetical protein
LWSLGRVKAEWVHESSTLAFKFIIQLFKFTYEYSSSSDMLNGFYWDLQGKNWMNYTVSTYEIIFLAVRTWKLNNFLHNLFSALCKDEKFIRSREIFLICKASGCRFVGVKCITNRSKCEREGRQSAKFNFRLLKLHFFFLLYDWNSSCYGVGLFFLLHNDMWD